jgi:hypothetical protein
MAAVAGRITNGGTMYALAIAVALDQAAAAELTPAEVRILAGPDGEEKSAVLQRHHNQLLKLTGTLTFKGGYFLTVGDGKAAVRLPVKIGDRDARRRLDRLTNGPKDPTVTLIGWARFRKTEERIADDYVVPDELKPKPRLAGRSETLDQTYARVQRQMIEEEQRQAAVKEDARRKGKLIQVHAYGPYLLDDASDDLKRYDAKPPT